MGVFAFFSSLNWKVVGYVVVLILFLVVMGGLYVVITRPTTSQSGQIRNIYTDSSTPLGGCSIWRAGLKATWQNTIRSEKK